MSNEYEDLKEEIADSKKSYEDAVQERKDAEKWEGKMQFNYAKDIIRLHEYLEAAKKLI